MRHNYILCLFVLIFTAANLFAWQGSGTEQDPYQISSAEDLVELSTTSGYSGSHQDEYFVMTQDIDMAEVTDFVSIGFQYNAFKGHFDGKNFKIKNLVVSRGGMENSTIGLFGAIENSTIQNVHIAGASYFTGNKYIAAVTGYAVRSVVKNCSSSAAVIGNGTYSQYIAGIVGHAFGTEVTECWNTGVVTAIGASAKYIGGVTGSVTNTGLITECYNLGLVTGTNHVGGVCGYVGTGDRILKSYNKGIVTGINGHVGGIAGQVESGLLTTASLTECYNTGTVTGKDYVGGITGESASSTHSCNIGNVESSGRYAGGIAGVGHAYACYNEGEVSGNDIVGGIIGSLSNLDDCYNTGDISGTTNVGGIVGAMSGTENELLNSYNIGSVSIETGNTSIGGLAGNVNTGGLVNANKLLNSYWNKDTYAGAGAGNLTDPTGSNSKFQYSGKTTAELKASGFPAVLGSMWAQDTQNVNNGYPVLTGAISTINPVANTVRTITASVGDNGTISYAGEIKTVDGSSYLFTFTPNTDYEVDRVLVNGENIGNVTSYNIENIDKDYTLQVTFKLINGSSLPEDKLIIIPQTIITNQLEINEAKDYNLNIISISGKILLSKRMTDVHETIEMSSFAQGIYFVELIKGNDSRTFKIVKR